LTIARSGTDCQETGFYHPFFDLLDLKRETVFPGLDPFSGIAANLVEV
jgi:hypothetical protein